MTNNIINQVYIDGEYVTPQGTELFDLYNPATGEVIGQIRLADDVDTEAAIAAAKRALPAWSATSREERIAALRKLGAAVAAKRDAILSAIVLEYGAPMPRNEFAADSAIRTFADTIAALEEFDFTRQVSKSTVEMVPLGVAALISPWNADAFFICNKLATALAAGCTAILKPSEMSATQTQVVLEAFHEAGLPKGVFNFVTGRGDVVGNTIARHRDVAIISFTGSTVVGKTIYRESADTMKRLTLELGGKSPAIILDDADLPSAVAGALFMGFVNSGQACVAGTRILVPESKKEEVLAIISASLEHFPAGDPRDPKSVIGPMASQRQWERIQSYIQSGIDEGARLLVGGLGRPEGLPSGYFVRPTVFADVTNDMTIAREEIFGPVLSVISYHDDDHAIEIANDTEYGLAAYIYSSNPERARRLASRIEAGRVSINGGNDTTAPFGGFKQSGIGREYGTYGIEEFLECRAIIV
jgi:aldehyde dehydrogenase (NAD+)